MFLQVFTIDFIRSHSDPNVCGFGNVTETSKSRYRSRVHFCLALTLIRVMLKCSVGNCFTLFYVRSCRLLHNGRTMDSTEFP